MIIQEAIKLWDFAQEYADSLYETLGRTAIVFDTNRVVAVSKDKVEYIGEPAGINVMYAIEYNEIVHSRIVNEKEDSAIAIGKIKSQVVVPISEFNNTAIGAVAIISDIPGVIGQLDIKLASVCAEFISRHLQRENNNKAVVILPDMTKREETIIVAGYGGSAIGAIADIGLHANIEVETPEDRLRKLMEQANGGDFIRQMEIKSDKRNNKYKPWYAGGTRR